MHVTKRVALLQKRPLVDCAGTRLRSTSFRCIQALRKPRRRMLMFWADFSKSSLKIQASRNIHCIHLLLASICARLGRYLSRFHPRCAFPPCSGRGKRTDLVRSCVRVCVCGGVCEILGAGILGKGMQGLL